MTTKRPLLLLVLAVLASTVCSGAWVATPVANASEHKANASGQDKANKLLASVLDVTRAERGFVWRSREKAGPDSYDYTTHVGTLDGAQTVDISVSGKTGSLSALLVGPKAYFKGNYLGLVSVNLTNAAAKAEAGKWVYVTYAADSAEYTSVASGLTVGTTVAGLEMAASVTELAVTKVDGRKVVPLKGTAAPTKESPAGGTAETLYVRATGKPYPVELVQNVPGVSDVATFGSWGSRASVKAPSHAVAFSRGWEKQD